MFLLAPLSSAKATTIATTIATVQTANQAVQAVNQDIQNLFAKQLKATFKQTTFTNLEPAPINFWYQAEVNNQVVYFNPTQALLFLGEVYTNNGISLSEQTRNKWQSRKAANLDLSTALVIGTGVIDIIEFTDTDCTFCRRFNQWISTINNAYKDKHNQDLVTRKIILTPIDQLHPNAHKEAVHILCQSPDNYETALTQTLESNLSFAEMDSCKKGKALLKKHRKIAQQLGISATPTLVINGQVIQGFNQQKLGAVIKQQLNKISRIKANKNRIESMNNHTKIKTETSEKISANTSTKINTKANTKQPPKVSEKWIETATNKVITVIGLHEVGKKGVKQQRVEFTQDKTGFKEELFMSVFMTFYKKNKADIK